MAASTPAIYARLAASRVRSRMQYRMSFVLQSFGLSLLALTDFAVIAVIFHHVPALGGWSLAEVAFLYGSSMVGVKLADGIVGGVELLPEMIRTGTLDVFLVRPLGSLGQVVTADVSLRHFGAIIGAAAIFGVAVDRAGVEWTPGRGAMVLAMFVAGFVIYAAVWIASNAIAFWLVDAREAANALTYGGGMLTSYPLGIFGPWLRRLLAFVIPLAFINYFPALYILDKRDSLGAPGYVRFLSPAVAVACAAVSGAVWRAAVRRYRSTGS